MIFMIHADFLQS